MSISYRLTATATVVTFAIYLTADAMSPYRPLPANWVSNATSFDLCTALDQVGLSVSLALLVWLVALVIVTVGGLRNRPAPRWIVVLCIIAFPAWAPSHFWRWQHCSSAVQIYASAIWYTSASVMCLHQVFKRRTY